jgi:hypothetical protein
MKQNESESDANGVYIGVESDPYTEEEWYLFHGGDNWRPPWTY